MVTLLSLMTVFLIWTSGPLLFAVPLQAELGVWVGQNRLTLQAQLRDDLEYYSIRELGRLAGLTLRETDNTLRIEGSRGILQLVDGRPLIRTTDEYIALSSPVWRRGEDDWFVPEDFLTQVLPLAIGQRIQKISDRQYRLQELARNQVDVAVTNQSGSVQVSFFSSQRSPIRVREFNRFIQVEFEQFLVTPEFPDTLPNRRLVLSVEYDASSVYGGFRIQKGEDYGSFREYDLTGPDRKVVEIFGSITRSDPPPDGVGTATVSELLPLSGPTTAIPDQSDRPGQPAPLLITIDPGHGGQDTGVLSADGLAEKDLSLAIADRVGRQLEELGFRVLLTRTRDVDLSVEQRGSIGNYYRASLYLSLHVGASPSPESLGPIVYVNKFLQPSSAGVYWEESILSDTVEAPDRLVPWQRGQERYLAFSRRLAERLQHELNLLWGVTNQVSNVPLALLSSVTAPAVLVETGYVTNAEDLIRLSFPQFQDQVANSITSALLGYLQDEELDRQDNP